jgi:beta-glucosidase
LIQKATRADIDTVVNNTLPEIGNDSVDDRQINRETAGAAIVLLKNDSGALPVQLKKGLKIAVLGPNAKARTVSSGGSAYLASSYVVTAYDAIKEAADKVGAEVSYSAGCYSKSQSLRCITGVSVGLTTYLFTHQSTDMPLCSMVGFKVRMVV